MDQKQFYDIANEQRAFFFTGATRDPAFRIKQLKIFRQAIENSEEIILNALKSDLGKPLIEAYGGEIAPLVREIDYARQNLRRWSRPRRVRTPLMFFPASSLICPEPYGSVLIIGPWNYPFDLLLRPLIGAMAAGNCAVIKPSEIAPQSSRVIAGIIHGNFDPSYIAVIEGGIAEAQTLLSQKFDYVFFSGSARVGKIIMEAAARALTPVTLELGGKCPCIVDQDIDLEVAARRITWGKFFNAGQSCVAPDYLLVHRSIKPQLLESIKTMIKEFYGDNPAQSPDYARIVNERHFNRLLALLCEGDIVTGGASSRADLYISPTIIDHVSADSKIMEDEIFGPLLPVLEYEDLDQVVTLLQRRPKPLALYFFSRGKDRQEKIMQQTSSGGVGINDCMANIQNRDLPFGGVGDSGLGAYHGKANFDVFSHDRSLLKRSFFDVKFKYPPYKIPLKYFKKILRIVS